MRIHRRSRIGLGGVLISIVAVLLAMGAVNSGNNLLVFVFGVVIGSILVSGFISGSMLLGVRIERTAPARMRVGEPGVISYDLRNAARFSHCFGLVVSETGDAPAARLGIAPFFVSHIAPRTTAHASIRVTPVRRGLARLEGVQVSSRFPIGFMEKTVAAPISASVIVHPRVAHLKRDPLGALSGRAVESPRRLPRSGSGDEFFGLREYSPGDPLRHVAWRPSAKSGTLIVRQHNEQRARALWILIDDTAIDEDAITLAASVAWEACERDMLIALSSAVRGTLVGPGRGVRHRAMILDALATIDSDHHNAAPAKRQTIGARAACIAIHARGGSMIEAPPGATHLGAGSLHRYEHAAPPERVA